MVKHLQYYYSKFVRCVAKGATFVFFISLSVLLQNLQLAIIRISPKATSKSRSCCFFKNDRVKAIRKKGIIHAKRYINLISVAASATTLITYTQLLRVFHCDDIQILNTLVVSRHLAFRNIFFLRLVNSEILCYAARGFSFTMYQCDYSGYGLQLSFFIHRYSGALLVSITARIVSDLGHHLLNQE